MPVRLLCVLAAVLGACGQTVSISIELTYQQDECANVPAGEKFLEAAGVATVHVIDPVTDSTEVVVLAEACFDFAEQPFRTVTALPRLLSENVELDELPLESIVLVQIAAYNGQYPSCAPFDMADPIKLPVVAGRSAEVELGSGSNVVGVPLTCPGSTDMQ